MVLKWRIVVGANTLWPTLTRSGIVEHTAERWTIDISSIDCESNNPSGVLIHDQHDPVRRQRDGLGPK